jgi:hypothetical protein
MGVAHANHHTCYDMKTHNDQQGIQAKLIAIWIHDMQILQVIKSQLSNKGKEALKPYNMSPTGMLSYIP